MSNDWWCLEMLRFEIRVIYIKMNFCGKHEGHVEIPRHNSIHYTSPDYLSSKFGVWLHQSTFTGGHRANTQVN